MYVQTYTNVYTCKFFTSDNPAEKLTNKNYVGQTAHKQTLSQRCMERGGGDRERAQLFTHNFFYATPLCCDALFCSSIRFAMRFSLLYSGNSINYELKINY